MAKTPPSRSSSGGSSKPSSKSRLKSGLGQGSGKRRLVRPPGWYLDRAKKSQAIKAALEAGKVIRPATTDSSSDSDSVDDHRAASDLTGHEAGVDGVGLEAGPSSPPAPPPQQSVLQEGLDAISSGSDSSPDDEDENEAKDRDGSGEDSIDGDEGPRDTVDVSLVGQRDAGLSGTPGHSGQAGPTQSTPLNIQNRPPSLDVSPTENTQDLNTNSG